MNTASFLSWLAKQGIELRLGDPGKIKCGCHGPLLKAIRALIQERKPEILAYLRSQQEAHQQETSPGSHQETSASSSASADPVANSSDPTTAFLANWHGPWPGSVCLVVLNGRGQYELVDARKMEEDLAAIRRHNAGLARPPTSGK